MDSKLFDDIENTLDLYIREDPAHPDMKVFSANAGFDPADVAEVIRTSVLLELKDFQKEILLASFVKREDHPEDNLPVPKISVSEWSGKRRREIRKDFLSCTLSVQDYLDAHPNISMQLLRNILDSETWDKRYDKKRPDRNWQLLIKTFIEDLPTISVQQFCAEQGFSLQTFQRHCPEEVYKARLEPAKRRTIDWPSEVEGMIKSDLCLEDWAYQHKLSLPIFREKCGEDVVKRYDRNGRRAAAFDPSLSMKENAEKLGLTPAGLSAWVNTKLKDIDPSKFEAFKFDEKDYQIIALQKTVSNLEAEKSGLQEKIAHLENVLANKNAQLSQLQTSISQKTASYEAFKKGIKKLLEQAQ